MVLRNCVVVLAIIFSAGSVWADEIEVKGELLEGEVAGISKDGLIFTSEYGSGDIVISWADLEEIRSDREMVVIYGDDGVAIGRLIAVDGDVVLVGSDRSSAQRVETASIYHWHHKAEYDGSRLERIRAEWRFWDASLALSGSVTHAGTNSQSLQVDLSIARKKEDKRLSFEGTYQIANSENEIDGEKDQILKRLFAQIRGGWDISSRGYLFGAQSFEWNKVEDLKARAIPRAGAGYRLIEEDWGFIAAEVAPSFVYEAKRDDCKTVENLATANCGTFTQDDPEDIIPPIPGTQAGRKTRINRFWSMSMGARAEVTLPYGSKLAASVDYFPNIEDWGAYLVRARGVFTLPVLEWVSLRLSLEDTFDSEAPEDARQNRFTGAIGLSVDF